MLHEEGPGSASAALSVLHIAWAPRAHFHALKQELGGELETLPDKSQSPTMEYDFHGGHFCLFCFVFLHRKLSAYSFPRKDGVALSRGQFVPTGHL